MGGGTSCASSLSQTTKGLSPRGRGNLGGMVPSGKRPRSIPAWAGEPSVPRPRPRMVRVYPRVGGGTGVRFSDALHERGLSPRGRGNHAYSGQPLPSIRSIPAWAGEPCAFVSPRAIRGVYPRVGGGTVPISRASIAPGGLSPRGRGNPSPSLSGSVLGRSIPAWAGEPISLSFRLSLGSVYPRVGGGTPYFANTNKVGISPEPIIGTSPSLLSDG